MTTLTVLMCTYNGSLYLKEQLDSLGNQTFRDWSLRVSDDGSTDGSPDLAAAFRDPSGRPPELVRGPGRGFAANFLSLIAGTEAGYVALADQDDVWFPWKLGRAMERLAALPADRPGLVCGRTLLTDGGLRPLGPSRLHRRFGFGNALVQNVVAGNTIVLNPAAHRLLRAAGVPMVPYHDWWCYLIVSGAGGTILYDPEPCMFYRQHGRNVLGENRSARAVLRRAGSFGSRTWRGWFEANIAALEANRSLLTPAAQARLDAFAAHDRGTALGRTRALVALAPWRQRRIESAALYAGTLIGLA